MIFAIPIIYIISMGICGYYFSIKERSIMGSVIAVMITPVINTVYAVTVLILGIKPFTKAIINEFKKELKR